MGAAALHPGSACKPLECECTAEHTLNIMFIVKWTIVLKTIPITHSCINLYFSITIISILYYKDFCSNPYSTYNIQPATMDLELS